MVYFPPEISLMGGSVLKMMYDAFFSRATSEMSVAALYCSSSVTLVQSETVIMKTVCTSVRAVSSEARS